MDQFLNQAKSQRGLHPASQTFGSVFANGPGPNFQPVRLGSLTYG
jgi:hypothetical protein